jgi:hypothetical protein
MILVKGNRCYNDPIDPPDPDLDPLPDPDKPKVPDPTDPE